MLFFLFHFLESGAKSPAYFYTADFLIALIPREPSRPFAHPSQASWFATTPACADQRNGNFKL
jgi:hypothetical protein